MLLVYVVISDNYVVFIATAWFMVILPIINTSHSHITQIKHILSQSYENTFTISIRKISCGPSSNVGNNPE